MPIASTGVRGGGECLGIKAKLDVLAVTLVATIMMVILGLIYFFLTILIIKVATDVLFDDTALSADWGAISAALVTAAVMISGALEKKKD